MSMAWLGCWLMMAAPPVFTPDDADLAVPFTRFTTQDAYQRTITGYLSKPPKDAESQKLPLILFITGSGSQSVFTPHGDKINSSIQGLLYQLAKGRARILVVEKVGVRFLDAPKRFGSAEEGSKQFLEEHTLVRWAEANAAALKAALALPEIDLSRVLVVGHSEGGIVAARVAAEVPAVSHVAPLGCSGVTQLYSMAELFRRRAPDGQGQAAMQQVFDQWAKMQAKPDSIEDFWLGHPYRRWTTFMKHSVLEELKRSQARIYLAHGTADEADAIQGFDVMRAELIAHGRDVTAERIEGGDHGFFVKDDKKSGMQRVMGNVVAWFLPAGESQ